MIALGVIKSRILRVARLLPLLLPAATPSLAADAAESLPVLFFNEKGCPHCRKVEDLLYKHIEGFYPVNVVEKSIKVDDNARKMIWLAEIYAAEEIVSEGAPAIFIDDQAFQGDRDTVLQQIEEAVRENIYTDAVDPLSRLREYDGRDARDLRGRITIPALLGAAAVDAINPCACAVLTLMLGSILLAARSGRRRRVIVAGLAFTSAVYICYVLMGLGIFGALEISGMQETVYIMAGGLAILVGVWNLKDAFLPDKLPSIEVPQAWRGRVKSISSAVTSAPGAFAAGCLISWILLPCTSGPYVVVLGLLGDTATRLYAFGLILLYNFIFIVPFIVITLLLAFGIARPYQIENWRQTHKRWLHLATGIFMLLLGIAVLALA